MIERHITNNSTSVPVGILCYWLDIWIFKDVIVKVLKLGHICILFVENEKMRKATEIFLLRVQT